MLNPQRNNQQIHDLPGRASRSAVILNKNAKRVTERVRKAVIDAAPDADVFFTESLEQARFVTRRVVDSGYGTVITGGGDGTVMNTIQEILARVDQTGGPRPRFGVLKLGTGNAVADFLGARNYATDLTSFDTGATRPVDLLRMDGGLRTTFCGFGWDALILNDYHYMRLAAERFAVTRALFKSAAGYLLAGVGKSVPALMIKRPSWNVRVVNGNSIGFRLENGKVVQRFAPGETVFDGPTRMLCAGTTPNYGFKFKIMPYADKTAGMFHLRLINMGALRAVSHLRSLWRGTYQHRQITDFQLADCHLEFDNEIPCQVAGDAAGYRSSVHLGLDTPIECFHFQR